MLKINTLKELKAEQVSLRVKKSRLENDIKLGFNELKAELTSFRSISKDAEELLASKDNHFLGFSLGTLADILTEKFLLKNSGLITKFILPIIVNKATSGLVEGNKTKIVGWLSNLTNKLAGKTE
jgi:hypothetical protein